MLERLGLLEDRAVEREELLSMMRGVSPADGRELRATGGDWTRVAGIDMTFSAPKSVSALWAVSSDYERARIEAAHAQAVRGALGRVEHDVAMVRSRAGGELHWQPRRLVAAEFVHTSSRLTREQGVSWCGWRVGCGRRGSCVSVSGRRWRARSPAPLSVGTIEHACARAEGRIGGRLSAEQREALARITGGGGVSVLVGQTGTGKGVVLGAASDGWREEGYEGIRTAAAGATAGGPGAGVLPGPGPAAHRGHAHGRGRADGGRLEPRAPRGAGG